MDMQSNVAEFVDLRRDVQHDAGEERRNSDRWSLLGGGPCGGGNGGDVRDEEFVRADLEHRLLVVQGREAGAGEHLRGALRVQELQQCREIGCLESEAKNRPAISCQRGRGSKRARRRVYRKTSAAQAPAARGGSQSRGCFPL